MIGIRLRRVNGCRPTARPIESPSTTAIANATASSKNVSRRARRHARRLPNRPKRGDHTRWRADKHRIDEPARRDFPYQQQQKHDTEPDHAGMPQQEGLSAHAQRLPRASRYDTTPLSTAAIATTKTM